jgi:hypothetical protein
MDEGVNAGLWLLQIDLNQRHNVLNEEYEFLCDAVLSITEEVNIDELSKIVAEGRSIRDLHTFNFLKPTERELISLFSGLTLMKQALAAVKEQADVAFVSAINIKSDETKFNYLATRGNLVSELHERFSERLRLAYTELAQAVDNFAGQLPQPLLMRRWNSNMYGEFLSMYSRHINWQCQQLFAMCNFAKVALNDKFFKASLGPGREIQSLVDEYRDGTVTTHSWGHNPISTIESSVIRSASDSQVVVASIESSYFYLENPALFPLLIHEYAHLYIRRRRKGASSNNGDCFLAEIIDRCVDSLQIKLAAAFPHEQQLEAFDDTNWHLVFEEFWADAIGILIGGESYLFAFFTSFIGQDGSNVFRQPDPSMRSMELNQGGHSDFKDSNKANTFEDRVIWWLSRLGFAIDCLQWVYTERKIASLPEWVDPVLDLIGSFYSGRRKTYSPPNVSKEDGMWAEIYGRVNKEALLVCAEEFQANATIWERYVTHIPDVDSYFSITRRNSKGDPIQSDLRKKFEDAFEHFLQSNLGVPDPKNYSVAFKSDTTIEQISPAIRWNVARAVDSQYSRNFGSLDKVALQNFGEWQSRERTDGSSVYRCAIEMVLLEKSVYETMGEAIVELVRKWNDLIRDESLSAETRQSELNSFAETKLSIPLAKNGRVINEILRVFNKIPPVAFSLGIDLELRRWIAFRGYTNPKRAASAGLSRECQDLTNGLHQVAQSIIKKIDSELAKAFFYSVKKTGGVEKKYVGVGLLTLGLVKTPRMSTNRQSQKVPSKSCGAELVALLNSAKQMVTSGSYSGFPFLPKTNLSRSASLQPLRLRPLLGDYNFISFQPGSTPSEVQLLRRGSARTIFKCRFVVSIRNQSDSPPNTTNGEKAGLVFLVKQRHRWHWIETVEKLRLRCNPDGDISNWVIHLSSSWDHMVLFVQPREFSNLSDLHLIPRLVDSLNLKIERDGADVQSFIAGAEIKTSYAVPTKNDVLYSNDLNGFTPMTASALLTRCGITSLTPETEETTGRSDFIIRWRSKNNDYGSVPISSFLEATLLDIPTELAEQVSWFSHGLRWPFFSPSGTNTLSSEVEPFTTIGLRRRA